MNLRAWMIATLCTLMLTFACVAQNPRKPDKITLAAYNVENMFDVFDDPYTLDESMPPKPRAAIERIAATIREINPDVLGLVEIENEGVIKAMGNEMLADMGYRYIAVLPTNSDRGINLGVMSRVPIVSITSHRFMELTLPEADMKGRTWPFARDLMKVVVQATPSRQMTLYIVHLKSRHDGPGDPMSANWRMAEHTMVRKIVAEQLQREPDAWLAVMGDFNDTPDAPGIVAYLGSKRGQPPLLHDVHTAPNPNRPITYLRGRYRSVIDYILASPALYQRLDAVGVPRNETELLEGSDHAPVWARFNIAE